MTPEIRLNHTLPLLLHVATAITGLIDALSYLALGHVFTANMTGNVVLLAFAVAGAPGLSIARSVVSLVAFLVGAVAGGRLAFAMAANSRRAWLLIAGMGEAFLLFAAAIIARRSAGGSDIASPHIYAVIVLTAVAMGLRNATVRRLAVPDLTTTVLTLTLTGVASESSLARGKNPRFRYRAASVVFMFSGAVVGALLLRLGPAAPLLLSG